MSRYKEWRLKKDVHTTNAKKWIIINPNGFETTGNIVQILAFFLIYNFHNNLSDAVATANQVAQKIREAMYN